MALQLGIIELRNIIKTIREHYGDDFSNYAITSFKRRLRLFIEKKKITHISEFLQMLEASTFYEDFLYHLAVEDTEMFRDPEMWSMLKTKLLHKVCSRGCKIWVAGSNSGEELYSLLIMLYETDYLKNADIICSTFNQKSLSVIKNGILHHKKLEASEANYSRYGGLTDFNAYFTSTNNNQVFKQEFLEHVNFMTLNLIRDMLPEEADLILYRNQMLYFNRVLQHEVLEKLHNSLNPGGYLVIGNKESIESFNIYNSFSTIDKSEGIYKRPSH